MNKYYHICKKTKEQLVKEWCEKIKRGKANESTY